MTHPTCAIATIAKNEGMFLLEWLAHHFAIGFDRIIIGTNDCEDGSDALLDAVSRHFRVTHLDNSKDVPGQTIHTRGMALTMAHSEVQTADWVMHIDPDEFVNIRQYGGQIKPFLKRHEGADAVALFWKLFGDNGRHSWDGGLVTDAFWACEAEIRDMTGHKTIFRTDAFGATTPHMPKEPRKPEDTLRVVNARGDILPVGRHYNDRNTGYKLPMDLLTWDEAFVAHMMVKSSDLSRMKQFRGSCNGGGQHRRNPGHVKHRKYNRNDGVDMSLQRTREARLEWLHMMMDIPEIADLHYGCLEWAFSMQRQMRKREAAMRLAG